MAAEGPVCPAAAVEVVDAAGLTRDTFASQYINQPRGAPVVLRGACADWGWFASHRSALYDGRDPTELDTLLPPPSQWASRLAALVGTDVLGAGEAWELDYGGDGGGGPSDCAATDLGPITVQRFVELLRPTATAAAGEALGRNKLHYMQWRGLPTPLQQAELEQELRARDQSAATHPAKRHRTDAAVPEQRSDTEPEAAGVREREASDGLLKFLGMLGPASLVDPSSVRERNVWAGRCVTSRIHFDGLDNLHYVLAGRKRVRLWSPWDTASLAPRGVQQLPVESLAGSSLAPDLVKAPRFLEADMYEAVVQPGDAIFIPAGWWHEVSTNEPSHSASDPDPAARPPWLPVPPSSGALSVNVWFDAHISTAARSQARRRPALVYLRALSH